MGSSSFCLPILEGLFESENDILAVYTQPPKPAGRGKKFLEVPV
ncbi:MAG: methionyl-tRNA formyltransferase, partial [Rhodobacteraceae bacterium]